MTSAACAAEVEKIPTPKTEAARPMNGTRAAAANERARRTIGSLLRCVPQRDGDLDLVMGSGTDVPETRRAYGATRSDPILTTKRRSEKRLKRGGFSV